MDVLEHRQEDFECFAAASPHPVSMLLALEGDPDAPDIPTSRSYTEAIEGPYSSQWQEAMDVEMASWKSTGTYVDEVPPPGANIVSGMWIFRVKRSPGSSPAFKARYVARGFSQRQGVDFFQTFSHTSKMTTLRVLLHVAAQRDYELHSLDCSTAFLQGSRHEEIWLRRPPGFTGSFPASTQWSLRWSVYGLRQAPREWHDTLRTTLPALGFAPSTSDPSLSLRTDTTLPPFYVLVYVDDLVFATADTEALAHVKCELQKRHTCTDLGELTSYLCLRITRDRAQRTITLTQSHMVQQVLQRFGFKYSSPQPTPLPTGHSLSAPPLDESVEPSGPYPEFVGCLITSGMGLVLGGRTRVVLTGHADASWFPDALELPRWHDLLLQNVPIFDLDFDAILAAMYALTNSAEGDCYLSVPPDPGIAAAGLGASASAAPGTGASTAPGAGESALSSTAPTEALHTFALEFGASHSFIRDSTTLTPLSQPVAELRWLTYLLADLGEAPRSPPLLYIDNKAMLALCQEHRLEHKTKHTSLRYFLTREFQQRGQLRLAYVASQANTADVFTKALQPCDHQRFCTVLGFLLLPTCFLVQSFICLHSNRKSTGTYVDEVPPPGANIVDGMWIFRVKRPPDSPPAFKARYVARGFSTQWSLRRPVYGLRQAPREWHDTLTTTLVALGFAPATTDRSLFLRTNTSVPPFYVLVFVDNLVFATADTEALALVKSYLQKRHTCTDLGELRSYLGLQITRDRARRTITLTQSLMVHQVLQRFGLQFSSPQPTPLSTSHSHSAPHSDKLMYLMICTRPDLEYPLSLLARYVAPGWHRKVHWDAAKRVLHYLCSMSGMGLVLGGRSPFVLTGHADASWVDNSATQRCEAEIYAGAMAALELRWLTYLLTDLGEQPCSPPVLYVDNKAMIALCQEHRLEHITKHIALRYFLARELQHCGQLRLAYVATQANNADVFTKALPPGDHQRFVTMLGLVPTLPHVFTV
ncbi:unnamed protein product [Closterium sp. NIES-54]